MGGNFSDRIKWVFQNPPHSKEEVLEDTSSLVACDFKFELSIAAGGGSVSSGQIFFYVPHVRGDDGRATGNGPYGACRAHEMGHAYAYWIHVKPCAERVHQQYGGRALSLQEQQQVERAYEACQTQQYWRDSGKYANEWERNYYDVTASGKFKRSFPTNPNNIGHAPRTIHYGGRTFQATDIWIAR